MALDVTCRAEGKKRIKKMPSSDRILYKKSSEFYSIRPSTAFRALLPKRILVFSCFLTKALAAAVVTQEVTWLVRGGTGRKHTLQTLPLSLVFSTRGG